MTTPDHHRLADRIAWRAARAGVDVDIPLSHSLAAYLTLLMRWNRRINLTALSDDDQGIDRLVIEPLAAVPRLPASDASITDIGSGGGSPAVPMKLAAPRARLRLVESRTRKAAFLREVVRQLRLEQTVVEACRYEALTSRQDLLGRSDVLTVRAVRIGGGMLHRLQPLLRAGGAVFLFRTTSDDLDAEVPSPLRVDATHTLLDSSDSRLVVLRKERRTAPPA